MDRTCAVILGMHRSGTSALAGTLAALGVDFGSDLIGANAGNPKGHFEMSAAVAFNDRLLRHFQGRWKRSFHWPADGMARLPREFETFVESLDDVSAASIWGIKDPRMCRLIPVWREILLRRGSVPHFIICVREPVEVVASLAQRDGLSPDLAVALWFEHLCAAESDTRSDPRFFLTYSELLATPSQVACKLAEFLGLPAPSTGQLAEITQFLDPDLHRQTASPGNSAFPIASRLYELVAGRDHEALSRCVDEILALQEIREAAVRSERRGLFR